MHLALFAAAQRGCAGQRRPLYRGGSADLLPKRRVWPLTAAVLALVPHLGSGAGAGLSLRGSRDAAATAAFDDAGSASRAAGLGQLFVGDSATWQAAEFENSSISAAGYSGAWPQNGSANFQSQSAYPYGIGRHDLSCMLERSVNFTGMVITQRTGTLTNRWRTCAVVSSSGVLTRHNHGPAIDKADLVIRFNAAPLKGMEAMVGRRDDLRFVNNNFPARALASAGHLRGSGNSRNNMVVNLHGKWYQPLNNTTYVTIPMAPIPDVEAFADEFPKVEFDETSKDLHESLSKTLRILYGREWFSSAGNGCSSISLPTTGGVGMVVALSICDEVRAYGMAATPPSRYSPHHYYDDSDLLRGSTMATPTNSRGLANTQNFHCSFAAEKDLWRKLATNSAADIDKSDVATIPGFSQYTCSSPPI